MTEKHSRLLNRSNREQGLRMTVGTAAAVGACGWLFSVRRFPRLGGPSRGVSELKPGSNIETHWITPENFAFGARVRYLRPKAFFAGFWVGRSQPLELARLLNRNGFCLGRCSNLGMRGIRDWPHFACS